MIRRLSLLAPVLGGPPAAADREILAGVLQDEAIQSTPVPPEASYLRDLSETFWGGVASLLKKGIETLHLPAWVLVGFVVLVVAVLLVVIVRLAIFVWRNRRGAAPRTEAGEVWRVNAVPAKEAEWDAATWRAELDRCLAEGRVAEGLRAAWWWLARSVAGERVEPDWTSRDLMARSGRHDLRDLVRGLDTLVYGPERPGLDDLRRLVGRMEAVLA